VQAFGGAVEIFFGVTTSEFGVGIPLTVKGVDDFQTGIRQAIFGTPQKTLIHTATQELTGSEGLAEAVDLATGLAAGGQIGARIKAADKAAKAAELADEVAAINRSENLLDKAFNGSGLVDESSGFSNFSRRADQIANEAKAAAQAEVLTAEKARAKVRATVEGNIAESKLAREAKAQAEINVRRIPDPWDTPFRGANSAGGIQKFDGLVEASAGKMLASSREPGTFISRVPSVQAKSGEFVTIQGKNATFKSGDKLVPEIVSALEAERPGVVQGVELEIFRTNGSKNPLTDIDILTQDAAIQVKTGSAKGLLEQMNATSTAAHGKRVVAIVTTDARPTVVRSVRDAGYEVLIIDKKGGNIDTVLPQILRK
jgi:hypothetical protein